LAFTFGKQAKLSSLEVLAEEPSVSELVVSLDQFYAVGTAESQFIGRTSGKIIF